MFGLFGGAATQQPPQQQQTQQTQAMPLRCKGLDGVKARS